jgi:hypothetical protein
VEEEVFAVEHGEEWRRIAAAAPHSQKLENLAPD